VHGLAEDGAQRGRPAAARPADRQPPPAGGQVEHQGALRLVVRGVDQADRQFGGPALRCPAAVQVLGLEPIGQGRQPGPCGQGQLFQRRSRTERRGHLGEQTDRPAVAGDARGRRREG
jgi:hypothetical protein